MTYSHINAGTVKCTYTLIFYDKGYTYIGSKTQRGVAEMA